MVCYHGLDYLGRFAETTGYLATDNRMRPLDLLVDSLTHVMQERCGFTDIHIGAQLVSNRSCENGDFY